MPSLDPPSGVIPTTPDELTPTWLATILTRHGFSAAIESIEFAPPASPPLTSQMLRVIPRFQDETTGVTPPLLWKRSLDDAEDRRRFRRGYAAEVAFYRDLAPGLSLSIPRCFAAAFDENTGAHVLILEELPGRPGDLRGAISPTQAERVLSEVAALHAAQWSDSGAAIPEQRFAHLTALVERHTAVSAPYLAEHVDDRAADRTRRYRDGVASIFSALSAGPRALSHGDLHPGNVIFPPAPGTRPSLVDWQGEHIDAPLRDVARFLVLGLTVEDRRAHEEALLAGYLAQLGVRGARYDTTAAMRDYRTASLLQWGWAVIFFRLEPLWDRDTRASMPTLVRRAAAAFDDAHNRHEPA